MFIMRAKTNKKKNKPSGIAEKALRLIGIYHTLIQKQYPSIETLCDRYEVNKRTIYRDLVILNLTEPIELDKDHKGYKFIHEDKIRKISLSDQEMMVLLSVGDLASRLGPDFKDGYQKLIERVLAHGKSDYPIKQSFHVKMAPAIAQEKLNKYFHVISACIQEQRPIELSYKAFGQNTVSERRVDPYGLIFNRGIWIMIGYCHLKEDIRSFALDRIVGLKEHQFHFTKKDSFDLEQHLSNSWGVSDNDPVNIKLRFTAKVAEYVTRRDKWHKSEIRNILENGEVELSFRVAGVIEIKPWIYSWIPNVRVLSPKWLRDEINFDVKSFLKLSQKG